LLSVLYVWLCNGSRGSILVAILAHAGTNVAGSLIPQDTLSDFVRIVVTLFAVVVIVWLTRGSLNLYGNSIGRPPIPELPDQLDAGPVVSCGCRDNRRVSDYRCSRDRMHQKLLEARRSQVTHVALGISGAGLRLQRDV
jgi:hypothetical protein